MRSRVRNQVTTVLVAALTVLAAACGSGEVISEAVLEQPETSAGPLIADNPFSGSLAEDLATWKEPAAGVLPGDRSLPAGDYDMSLPYQRRGSVPTAST